MNYIQTFYGHKIDFFNPDPDQIDIRDIAHALAVTPRFAGHTSRFYPVAAHSMMVAELSSPGYKLEGLLHDATEAYLTDMPTPFKNAMPEYKAAEERIWLAICAKLGLGHVLPGCVKLADRLCLMKEADVLQPNRTSWGDEYENHPRAQRMYNVVNNNKTVNDFLDLYGQYGGR